MAAPKTTFETDGNLNTDWFNEMACITVSRRSVSIAGTGDYVLPAVDYRCRTLILTGALTGNRNVIVPGDGGRTWTIVNSTSWAYTVTVKVSGGTGIAIRQGCAAMVREDGTNVERVSPDVVSTGAVLPQSVANVSSPPTDAELDAAFGEPATLGRGFVATVDDNDGDTTFWLVMTSDASWYHVQMTKST